MRQLPWFILLFVALSGCSLLDYSHDSDGPPGSGSDLVLATDIASYAFSEVIELRLVNGSDDTVGHNLCSAVLERRAGGRWVEIHGDRVCQALLGLAEPGARVTQAFPVAGYFEGRGFDAGTYRLTAHVEVGSDTRRISTAPFELTK